jgi:hypothetical protein
MKLALAVLAALLIAPAAAQAQGASFGHFGDYSSTQGAAAPWSATAPGMYASGQYAYVGPYTVVKMGPYGVFDRLARYSRPTIYVPSNTANIYEPLPPPENGAQPSANTKGGTNTQGGAQERVRNDLGRFSYDRGFRDGYNAGMNTAAPPRTETLQRNPFASR